MKTKDLMLSRISCWMSARVSFGRSSANDLYPAGLSVTNKISLSLSFQPIVGLPPAHLTWLTLLSLSTL